MTGVIYARYSSDHQREESIEGQIRECEAYAKKNGIRVLKVYTDRAFSAKSDNRPDFQKMITDSHRKLFDVIIVWKLDRFSRDRYHMAHYKHILQKNNVQLLSATEPIPTDPAGIMMESMLVGMAEYYSVELAQKINRGMTENALKCKYNGGTLPVGYKINKQTRLYEIDTTTSPIVREVYNAYLDGKTMKQIADNLNERGYRNTIGRKFSINSISRMLQNRHYIGEYKYKDIITPNGVPAIISPELFDAVQERISKTKKAPSSHKAVDDYLLTTKLYCGHCGSFMVGESGTSNSNRIYRYYKCITAKRRKGCHKKAVRKEWIEDIVINEIRKFLYDDEAIDEMIKLVMQAQRQENKKLPLLKKELRSVEKGINNMLNAIQDGIYNSSTKRRLDELEERKEALETEIANEQLIKPLLEPKKLKFYFINLRKLDTTKLEDRRSLINNFVNAVVLHDDRIDFVFNYQDGTKTVTFEELKEESADSSDLLVSARPKFDRILRFILHFRSFFISFSGVLPPLLQN